MEPFDTPQPNSVMLLISGPAGCGKTTLCDSLLENYPEAFTRIITATTRLPREGEQDGVDYYFFDKESFEQKVQAGAFYEHALIHGNRYGTLKAEVANKLSSGKDILLNVDVQGAAAFREQAQSDALLAEKLSTIFVMPAALDVLRERMEARGKDSEEVIRRRLETAAEEIPQWKLYDYSIVTSTREADYDALNSIYNAAKLRVVR